MRHRSLSLPPGLSRPASDESDQEAISVPKGRNTDAKNLEKPADEMARLIRVIAGKPTNGEKDEQLRARAARRLGISTSRAKVLWYRETDNIKSSEMDAARELALILPIEEAITSIEVIQKYLNDRLERLLDQVTGSHGDHGRDHPAHGGDSRPPRPSRMSMAGKSRGPASTSSTPSLAGLNRFHGRLSTD